MLPKLAKGIVALSKLLVQTTAMADQSRPPFVELERPREKVVIPLAQRLDISVYAILFQFKLDMKQRFDLTEFLNSTDAYLASGRRRCHDQERV